MTILSTKPTMPSIVSTPPTMKTQLSRPEPACLCPLDNAGHQPRAFGDHPHLRPEMAVVVGIVPGGVMPVGVVSRFGMGLCFACHQCPPLRGYWSIFFR